MSGIDWDGNMTHGNYDKKPAIVVPKKKAAKPKVQDFFESDDESDFVVMLPKPKAPEKKEKQDGEIDEINLNNSNEKTTSSKTVDDGMPFNEAIVSASGEISVKKGSIKSSKKGEVAESAESDKACCALF